MSDLVAFLTARLDEDEAAAKAWAGVQVFAQMNKGGNEPDPRPLREVEAKRKILDRHAPHETAFDGLACDWCSEDVDDRPQLAKERWPCGDVRAVAAIWSDHPDYQQEWA